jgi:hypothetical protein
LWRGPFGCCGRRNRPSSCRGHSSEVGEISRVAELKRRVRGVGVVSDPDCSLHQRGSTRWQILAGPEGPRLTRLGGAKTGDFPAQRNSWRHLSARPPARGLLNLKSQPNTGPFLQRALEACGTEIKGHEVLFSPSCYQVPVRTSPFASRSNIPRASSLVSVCP